MKKLMFTFAMVAAMVSLADIESSNVVGYQDMGLTADKQVMKGAMFVTPGAATLNLQDISMDANLDSDGGTMLWWWDKNTRTYTRSYWVDLYDSEGTALGSKGWGDGENWVAMEKNFKSGEGFWVQAAAAGSVSVAGEVATVSDSIASLAYDLTADKQEQVTNPFPVGSFDLQSVAMNAELDADGGTMAWWWDKNTRTYTRAYWVDLYDSEGTALGTKGWGDGENWIAMEKTFEAGEAFWVQAAANAQVIWSNPSYKAK